MDSACAQILVEPSSQQSQDADLLRLIRVVLQEELAEPLRVLLETLHRDTAWLQRHVGEIHCSLVGARPCRKDEGSAPPAFSPVPGASPGTGAAASTAPRSSQAQGLFHKHLPHFGVAADPPGAGASARPAPMLATELKPAATGIPGEVGQPDSFLTLSQRSISSLEQRASSNSILADSANSQDMDASLSIASCRIDREVDVVDGVENDRTSSRSSTGPDRSTHPLFGRAPPVAAAAARSRTAKGPAGGGNNMRRQADFTDKLAVFRVASVEALEDMAMNKLLQAPTTSRRSRPRAFGTSRVHALVPSEPDLSLPAQVPGSPDSCARGAVEAALAQGAKEELLVELPCAKDSSLEVQCHVEFASEGSLAGPLSNSNSGFLTFTSGMEALRVRYESMLVSEEGPVNPAQWEAHPQHYASFHKLPLLLLAAVGVMPLKAGRSFLWYRCVVFGLVAALLSHSTASAALEEGTLYLHLCTSCLALGALLGLAFLWNQRVHELFAPRHRPLVLYADSNTVDTWRLVSSCRCALIVALVAGAAVCKVVSWQCADCSDMPASRTSLAMFVAAHALLGALVHCHLHVCCGLELAIDSFCTRFFMDQDLAKGITDWNILQAMLRRAAHAIEGCFLAVSTSVLGVVMLTAVQILNMGSFSSLSALGGKCGLLWAGWVLPLVALPLYATFRAAAITEKCLRVPSLLNSWITNEGVQFDHQRQYFVQYVIQSDAGFYLKGVRVNAMWAWKVTYLFGVVVFTLATQSVTI